MHTTGLLPAGERPQFKMVSLTLQNGAIENSGCIQNFTSWAAKNSADMITTLGRNINSRARSPGPSCTKEGWKFYSPLLMQRVFFSNKETSFLLGTRIHTSLDNTAVTPCLSHKSFSCWPMVVSGTMIQVVEPGAILIVAFISTIRNDLTRRHEEGCHKHGKSLAPTSWNTVEYMVAIVW